MARSRKEKIPEKVTGTFSAIPHCVIDSVSFTGASDKAKALLFALVRQLNGKNNGHLQLTSKWLKTLGYTCPANNIKSRKELINRGLVVQTKYGGLNMSADLFAVTWLPISNNVGLDITPSSFVQGAYTLCKLPPTKRREVKKKTHYSDCNNAVTQTEIDKPIAITMIETDKGVLRESTVTPTENNVSIPYTIRKDRQASIKHRVIGVKGKSGVQT